MGYLEAGEFERYGLDAAVPDAWVAMASALIEAHCKRPSLEVTQYTERVRVFPGQTAVRLSYLPVADVLSARGRFAQARRGEFVMEVASAFGIPGTWTAIDASSLDVFGETGEVSVLTTVLGFTFDELEVTYSAGWLEVPEAVKQSCAQIVRNAAATPALNVKSSSVDQMRVDYFKDSLVDESVRKMLAPYVAQKVG